LEHFRRKIKRGNEMKTKTKDSRAKEKKSYHLVLMEVVATGRKHPLLHWITVINFRLDYCRFRTMSVKRKKQDFIVEKFFFSRKNPDHFQEYSHEQESDKSENEGDDDLPECPYGEYCYRKNPRHRREYKHTPRE
jgi:hypothetical protein